MTAAAAQSRALGKLLLIQQALEVLPNEASIAAFLCRSLSAIPGVKDVHVCIRGVVTPDDARYGELCRACGEFESLPATLPLTKLLPLRTPHQIFGALYLSFETEDQFSFLHPYVANTANVVTTLLESRDQVHQLKVANELIQRGRDELELKVKERTAELARINGILLEDIARREAAETALLNRNAELSQLNVELSKAQEHLVQSEKLASIGELAAGVAHEINNPIGYIFSNFSTLEKYLADLFEMLGAYEKAEAFLGNVPEKSELQTLRRDIELDFLKEDIPALMRESRDGIVRVRKIVQDLKDFSHVDVTSDWQFANLNQGIDSTLNVVNNELKYKADVVKDYGDLPEVQCLPSQINQVVMNLLVNAAQAMGIERGKVTVRTGVEGEKCWFEVSDTGCGIPKDALPRIFDPFYTTKPVGKGTGLGLSLSYGIIQKHQGSIDVQTELGRGTTFRVTLPIRQSALPAVNGAVQA